MTVVVRAQLTFQMLTLVRKYLYRQSQYLEYMGPKMFVPDSSSRKSIRNESEGWGLESPSGRDMIL